MSTKSKIHTAEMTDPGGENQGLLRVVYQVATELAVKIEPMTPAIWHIAMHKMSLASSPNFMEFIKLSLLFLEFNFFGFSIAFLWLR
jgi:hypothetical protein